MERGKIVELVRELEQGVVAQTDCVAQGKIREGNAHARRYLHAFQKLRALGDAGRDAVKPLLHHDRADVRTTAAAFLLRHCHDEAMATLRREAAMEGPDAFAAAECIQRWEDGTWALDPADSVPPIRH